MSEIRTERFKKFLFLGAIYEFKKENKVKNIEIENTAYITWLR